MRLYHAGSELVLIVCLMLTGCADLSIQRPTPTAASVTQATVPPADHHFAPSTSSPPQPTDTGWVQMEPGVEIRTLQVQHHERLAPIRAVRLDPAYVTFGAGYAPDTLPNIGQWCEQTGVRVVINGGFFQPDYQPSALVISNGLAYGTSYQGLGGMFAVDATGKVSLRYLGETPYHPDELLQEAIQSWPMLVLPGGRVGYANPDEGEVARRSVLAMDYAGRVLILAFMSSAFTLHELGPWLLATDMEIDAALNLDGGSSTGLCVKDSSGQSEIVQAFSPLPLVLSVYQR